MLCAPCMIPLPIYSLFSRDRIRSTTRQARALGVYWVAWIESSGVEHNLRCFHVPCRDGCRRVLPRAECAFVAREVTRTITTSCPIEYSAETAVSLAREGVRGGDVHGYLHGQWSTYALPSLAPQSVLMRWIPRSPANDPVGDGYPDWTWFNPTRPIAFEHNLLGSYQVFRELVGVSRRLRAAKYPPLCEAKPSLCRNAARLGVRMSMSGGFRWKGPFTAPKSDSKRTS